MNSTKFTEDHHWIRLADDGTATIGITDYAQEQLGDVVYVALPEIGKTFQKGTIVVEIESVKAVGEVTVPSSVTVTDVNKALEDTPELLNSAPLTDGWIARVDVKDATTMESLMSEESYAEFVASL